MRARLLAAALGLLVLGALLARGTGRGAAWAPLPPARAPRIAGPPPSLPAAPAARRAPSRNLFEYVDERPAAPALPAPMPPPLRALVEVPERVPPPAVRVAGLVRRAGELKAALVVQGEMTVAGKGDRAGDYTVVEVNEETGVRLRGPGGEELLLAVPRL